MKIFYYDIGHGNRFYYSNYDRCWDAWHKAKQAFHNVSDINSAMVIR